LSNIRIWQQLDKVKQAAVELSQETQGTDILLLQHGASILSAQIPFNAERSRNILAHEYEALSYPLKDPLGVSAWHLGKKFPSGVPMTIFNYAKATLYQSTTTPRISRLTQEWALDMLSRHETNTRRVLHPTSL
jgi:hypothetical protein